MPGKRLRDSSLTRTTYPEAVSNNAEILTDWNGLVWARPIPLKLVGNSWMQGSYDSVTWDNFILDDHNYLRVSTDGGVTWRIIILDNSDSHPPVSIGSPDGGLSISGDDSQILTLSPAGPVNSGSMSALHWTKLEALKFDYLDNLGTGSEIYKTYSDSGDTRTHYLRTLVAGSNITLTEGVDSIQIDASASSGEINTASNVGTGEGIFYQKDVDNFEFKTIIAGTNVTITDNGLDLTIDATDTDTTYSASNLGTKAVYKQTVGTDFQFKGLVAGTNVTITELANDLQIDFSGTGGGETNDGDNVGTGTIEWFKQKNGVNLEFRTFDEITSGDSLNPFGRITFSSADTGDTILIGTTAELNTAANVGAGSGIYKEKVDEEFKFKTLVAGTGVTLTPGTDTIQIDATGAGGGEVNTASNVGTGAGLFKQKTGVDLEFKSLIFSGATVTENTNDVTVTLPTPVSYTMSNIGTGNGQVYSSLVSNDFKLRKIKAGSNVSVITSGDDIIVSASSGTGETNTASNYGTDGVGPYDSKSGVNLRFRNLASVHDGLTITLDATDHDIDFDLSEPNINHDLLLNFVANEHIDHSSVSILTTEGIQGGGDITSTRTLLLDFFHLDSHPTGDLTYGRFALYDTDLGHHYQVTLSELSASLDIPAVPTTYTYAGAGLANTGSAAHDPSATLRLDINNLSTGVFDPTDGYIAFYDSSTGTHYKSLLNGVVGTVTSITEGGGINLTPNTITTTGSVALATPLTVSNVSTNSTGSAGSGHTHALSIPNLSFIGDVTNSPTTNYYLQWNGSSWVTTDPAIGASSPGDPANSLQFNNAGSFGGNSGLLYYPSTDTLQFSDPNASSGMTLLFGSSTASYPYIKGSLEGTARVLTISNRAAFQNYIELDSGRLIIGQPTLDGTVFTHVQDPNTTPYSTVFRIDDFVSEEIFKVTGTGQIYTPKIDSSIEDNILYFDSATGKITYGAASSGTTGGAQTLIADNLSGLMVNGDNSSSASEIELDQNDNKLTLATVASDDYIGFYDVSESLQSKTLFSDIVSWKLNVNDVYKEDIKLFDSLNFKALDNVSVSYDTATNTISIGAQAPNFPPYSFAPNALISYDSKLYKYDVANGTAMLLPNAPIANYNRDTVVPFGDTLLIASGTNVFIYDIVNDTSTSYSVAGANIFKILVGDGIYVFADNNKCYYASLDFSFITDYGDTGVSSVDTGGADIGVDSVTGKGYLLVMDNSGSNDYIKYKEVYATYSGSATDAFSQFTCPVGDATGLRTGNYTNNTKVIITESDNGGIVINVRDIVTNNIGIWIGGSGVTLLDNNYVVPSGRVFSDGSSDSVKVLKRLRETEGHVAPTGYSIILCSGYTNSDSGLYVTQNNAPFTSDNTYEFIFNSILYDVYESTTSNGAYVIVGGSGGNVYFHNDTESYTQFTGKQVTEVTDNNLLQGKVITSNIDFVYYEPGVTDDGTTDPKESTGFKFLDLYVNDVLEEENITKLNLVEDNGVTLTYGLNGKVTVSYDPAVAAAVVEDIAFDFNDVSGEEQTYILDIETSFYYNIIEAVLQSDSDVVVTINDDATTVLSDTVTATKQTFAIDSDVYLGSQITLNLAISSATTIRGKLRIIRIPAFVEEGGGGGVD